MLTLKAVRLIEAASVVFHDALVGPDILDLIPANVRRVPVGKRAGHHSQSQDAINGLLVRAASDGERVVRLKDGDPSIFGRSAEEMDDAFYKSVSSIVDNLKQRPVTVDELTRARQPMIDHLRSERNTNGYWMSLLTGSVRDPRQIATSEAREKGILSVTAADITGLARTYLDMFRGCASRSSLATCPHNSATG